MPSSPPSKMPNISGVRYDALLLAAHRPTDRWWPFSPAILILAGPLGFRATCSLLPHAYTASFFLDHPACAVGEFLAANIIRRRKRFIFPCILPKSIATSSTLLFSLSALSWLRRLPFFSSTRRFGVGVGSLVLTLKRLTFSSRNVFPAIRSGILAGGKLECASLRELRRYRFDAWRVSTYFERAPHAFAGADSFCWLG